MSMLIAKFHLMSSTQLLVNICKGLSGWINESWSSGTHWSKAFTINSDVLVSVQPPFTDESGCTVTETSECIVRIG